MSTNVYKLVNGERIELTEEENNQRIAISEALEKQEEARAWLNGRLSEYGSWQEQLDEMFHDFDAWKARIQSVKDAFPKPSE